MLLAAIKIQIFNFLGNFIQRFSNLVCPSFLSKSIIIIQRRSAVSWDSTPQLSSEILLETFKNSELLSFKLPQVSRATDADVTHQCLGLGGGEMLKWPGPCGQRPPPSIVAPFLSFLHPSHTILLSTLFYQAWALLRVIWRCQVAEPASSLQDPPFTEVLLAVLAGAAAPQA